MRALSLRRLTSSALAAMSLGVASCQLDKLIVPPNDPLPPVLSVVRIDESASVGSLSPKSIEISLTNPGDHLVSWTALITAESPWLTLDQVADTAPSSLMVTLAPEILTVGAYIDTVVIARTDRPDVYVNVPVAFEIMPCHLIDVVGNAAFADVVGDIDCAAPHWENHFAKLYRVLGQPDDTVSVMLESSEFDAFLILADNDDPEQEPLLTTSTCSENPDQACVAYLRLGDFGQLYIEVTSDQPMDGGAFALNIYAPRPPSTPTGLNQFADQQGTAIPEGGTIPNNEMFIEAGVFDVDPADSIRLEIEIQTTATPFSFVPTHMSDFVTAGEVPMIRVADLLDDTDYKWHARTVDLSGRFSDWVTFGVSEPDFQIRIEDAPHLPLYLGQFENDLITPVPPGGTIDEQTIALAGVVVDNDANELVRLEVEVRTVDTKFQNTPTASSVLVSSGDTATVIVGGLEDGANYHWQARAVDQNGLQGPWKIFGDTHGLPFDFRIGIVASQLFISAQPTGGVAGQRLSTLRVEARKPNGAIDQSFNSPVLVDLTPGTGTPGAALSGTIFVSAKGGVAVFSNLSIDLTGANYRLTLLTAGLPPVVTAPFSIRNPVPAKMAIITQPAARAASGQVLVRQPVIEFRDAAGNPVGLSGLQVTASLTSGPVGAIGGTTTISTDAKGKATFTDLVIKGTAGSYTIGFADATGRVPQVISTIVVLVTAADIGPTTPSSSNH